MNTSNKRPRDRFNLAERLRERIRREGPITFHDWMKAALYDPTDGYYCRPDRQRWGRAGDYRTSPERSPLFAATFARYFARLYEAENSPARWTIVEMGAGEGHFAERVLEDLSSHAAKVFSATRYVIDEVSGASGAVVKERLSRFSDRIEFCPLAELEPIEKGVVFSNELLDAFPVHRVTVSDGQLRELYVDLDSTGEFTWTSGPPSSPRIGGYVDLVGVALGEGELAEINLAIEDWLTNLTAKLCSGYVVTVDYGVEESELGSARRSRQGTLRAFKRHQFVEVLSDPGDQDITSTIDWSFVREVGEKLGFETIEFQRLDRFLLRSGLLDQLESMIDETQTEAEKMQLRTAAREMILPDGMAPAYQVLVQRKAKG